MEAILMLDAGTAVFPSNRQSYMYIHPITKALTKNNSSISIQHLCPTPAANCPQHVMVICLAVVTVVVIEEVGVIKAEELEVAGVEAEVDSGIPLLRLLYRESGYKSWFCVLSRPALSFPPSANATF
jgi:hypothetical protein